MDKDSEAGGAFYFPAPTDFEDTGAHAHVFTDGSIIVVGAEESNDSDGFCVRINIKDSNRNDICDFTADRFAALCMIESLSAVLIAQDDIRYKKIKENNDKFGRNCKEG